MAEGVATQAFRGFELEGPVADRALAQEEAGKEKNWCCVLKRKEPRVCVDLTKKGLTLLSNVLEETRQQRNFWNNHEVCKIAKGGHVFITTKKTKKGDSRRG